MGGRSGIAQLVGEGAGAVGAEAKEFEVGGDFFVAEGEFLEEVVEHEWFFRCCPYNVGRISIAYLILFLKIFILFIQ